MSTLSGASAQDRVTLRLRTSFPATLMLTGFHLTATTRWSAIAGEDLRRSSVMSTHHGRDLAAAHHDRRDRKRRGSEGPNAKASWVKNSLLNLVPTRCRASRRWSSSTQVATSHAITRWTPRQRRSQRMRLSSRTLCTPRRHCLLQRSPILRWLAAC